MPSDDTDNLQLMGGALIVLSLALLYCWWSKQSKQNGCGRRYEGFKSYIKDHTSKFEGARSKYTPGLTFNTDKQASMHDLEGMAVNRNPLTDQQKRSQVTGLRWQVEGMENVDMTDMFDRSYDDARGLVQNSSSSEYGNVRGPNRPLSADILTPMKPNPGSTCASHSLDQLIMTDRAETFGKNGTFWGDPVGPTSVSL